jgi:hypothetical protein
MNRPRSHGDSEGQEINGPQSHGDTEDHEMDGPQSHKDMEFADLNRLTALIIGCAIDPDPIRWTG